MLQKNSLVCEKIISRAQGCLLGLIAGDNLGSMVEFQSEQEIKGLYPNGLSDLSSGGVFNLLAGQPTDDGELALTLARTLVSVGKYDIEAVAKAYRAWLLSEPFDIGGTIVKAFGGAARSKRPDLAAGQATSCKSQANGALMRIAPLALWGWGFSDDTLACFARKDAKLSHAHRICLDANAVFVVALKYALTGATDIYQSTKQWVERSKVHPIVSHWLSEAEHYPPEDYYTHMGWVKVAFQNAFYQLGKASSALEGVSDTVMRGGDTDTNGAICGALLGAKYGFIGIPQQWVISILTCTPRAGCPSVHQSRPSVYWPNDVLTLAKNLVLV